MSRWHFPMLLAASFLAGLEYACYAESAKPHEPINFVFSDATSKLVGRVHSLLSFSIKGWDHFYISTFNLTAASITDTDASVTLAFSLSKFAQNVTFVFANRANIVSLESVLLDWQKDKTSGVQTSAFAVKRTLYSKAGHSFVCDSPLMFGDTAERANMTLALTQIEVWGYDGASWGDADKCAEDNKTSSITTTTHAADTSGWDKSATTTVAILAVLCVTLFVALVVVVSLWTDVRGRLVARFRGDGYPNLIVNADA